MQQLCVYKYVHLGLGIHSWTEKECKNLYTSFSFHLSNHKTMTSSVCYYSNLRWLLQNISMISVKICILLISHNVLYLIILILGFTAELKTLKKLELSWQPIVISSSYYLSNFVNVQTTKKPQIISHSHQYVMYQTKYETTTQKLNQMPTKLNWCLDKPMIRVLKTGWMLDYTMA